MVNLEDFKKSLGNLVDELSEEQIIELREQQDQMAELLISSWMAEINKIKV